jgi:hypothetical protein
MSEKIFDVNFHDLAWAAVCFYYRSIADRKYCKIMGDTAFTQKLRQMPFEIRPSEFEQKALLDYVNISSYDLLVGHKLAESLLEKIIGLQPDLSALQDMTLLDCDLSDSDSIDRIKRIYSILSSVPGIWITGVSKIAHLLNNRLLVMLNLDISNHFGLLEGSTGLVNWFKIMQNHAKQITKDFHDEGFSGTPEEFISEKLGYTSHGCHKSLVKYLDEYYWLRFADRLPVPPRWTPSEQVLTSTGFMKCK